MASKKGPKNVGLIHARVRKGSPNSRGCGRVLKGGLADERVAP